MYLQRTVVSDIHGKPMGHAFTDRPTPRDRLQMIHDSSFYTLNHQTVVQSEVVRTPGIALQKNYVIGMVAVGAIYRIARVAPLGFATCSGIFFRLFQVYMEP